MSQNETKKFIDLLQQKALQLAAGHTHGELFFPLSAVQGVVCRVPGVLCNRISQLLSHLFLPIYTRLVVG